MMKPAHKTLMPIFALLAIALFAACSSDSADSDDDFAGTVWSYSYGYFDDDYNVCPALRTLFFHSGGKVTVVVYMDNEIAGAENGTYSVSGSTVTLNLDDSGTIVLIYSSSDDQLVYYSSMEFTTSSNLDTFDASSLAGTTWTYEYTEDGTAYKNEIKFEDDDNKTFTVAYYTGNNQDPDHTYSKGVYSVDGTTVTVDYKDEDKDRQTTYIYSDGKLVFVWVFTYNGTI